MVLIAAAPVRAERFAGADVDVIGQSTRAGHVAAYHGVVAWNGFGRGRHNLVVRVPGQRLRTLAGVLREPLHREFDVGPAPGGGVAVVYTRCRGGFRDCDVYMQRVGEWVERPVPGVNTRRFGEVRPAIWGDLIAFVRIANGGRSRRNPFIRIFVRRMSGGASRRLPGGPLGNRPPPGSMGLHGMDIGPRGVVFTWASRNLGGETRYRVFLDGLRGGQRLIDEVVSPDDSLQMHSASERGSVVSYLVHRNVPGAETFTLRHFDLITGMRSQTELPCAVTGLSNDGPRFAFLHTRGECPGVPIGPPRLRVLYGERPPSSPR